MSTPRASLENGGVSGTIRLITRYRIRGARPLRFLSGDKQELIEPVE
jgi:hypothetical protein